MCCLAAALVGGSVARLNESLTDFLAIARVYAWYLNASSEVKSEAPYQCNRNFSPAEIRSFLQLGAY